MAPTKMLLHKAETMVTVMSLVLKLFCELLKIKLLPGLHLNSAQFLPQTVILTVTLIAAQDMVTPLVEWQSKHY